MYFTADRVDFTTLLFANNQINIADSKDQSQEAVHKLSQTVGKQNVSSKKTKIMAIAAEQLGYCG
jgi:hypothetical protein